jgi:hypothetical protein
MAQAMTQSSKKGQLIAIAQKLKLQMPVYNVVQVVTSGQTRSFECEVTLWTNRVRATRVHPTPARCASLVVHFRLRRRSLGGRAGRLCGRRSARRPKRAINWLRRLHWSTSLPPW